MIANPTLNLHDFHFSDLFHAEGLYQLDQRFLKKLHQANSNLHTDLMAYREDTQLFSPEQISELLLAAAPILEDFLIELFHIEAAAAEIEAKTVSHNPVSA